MFRTTSMKSLASMFLIFEPERPKISIDAIGYRLFLTPQEQERQESHRRAYDWWQVVGAQKKKLGFEEMVGTAMQPDEEQWTQEEKIALRKEEEEMRAEERRFRPKDKFDTLGRRIVPTLQEQEFEDHRRRAYDWWRVVEAPKKSREPEEEQWTQEEETAMRKAEEERRAEEKRTVANKRQQRFKKQKAMYKTAMPRFMPALETIPEFKMMEEFSKSKIFWGHQVLIMNSKTMMNFRQLRENEKKCKEEDERKFNQMWEMKKEDKIRRRDNSLALIQETMVEYANKQKEIAARQQKENEHKEKVEAVTKKLKKQMKKEWKAMENGTLTLEQAERLTIQSAQLQLDYEDKKESERKKLLKKQQEKKTQKEKTEEVKRKAKAWEKEKRAKAKKEEQMRTKEREAKKRAAEREKYEKAIELELTKECDSWELEQKKNQEKEAALMGKINDKKQEEEAERLREEKEQKEKVEFINKNLKKQRKKEWKAMEDGTLTWLQAERLKTQSLELELDFIVKKEKEREKLLKEQQKKDAKEQKKKKTIDDILRANEKKAMEKEEKQRRTEQFFNFSSSIGQHEDVVKVPCAHDRSAPTGIGHDLHLYSPALSKEYLEKVEKERKKQMMKEEKETKNNCKQFLAQFNKRDEMRKKEEKKEKERNEKIKKKENRKKEKEKRKEEKYLVKLKGLPEHEGPRQGKEKKGPLGRFLSFFRVLKD